MVGFDDAGRRVGFVSALFRGIAARGSILVLVCFLGFCTSSLPAQEKAGGTAPRPDALLQEIRDRIIWHDQEKTDPLLIPEDVIGLVAIGDLPIPEGDREAIQLWIHYRKNWRSPAGLPYPECPRPRMAENTPVAPEEQVTFEKVIVKGAVSLLVTVDKTTVGYWPDEGIYQYNEVTPIEAIVGADFPDRDPLSTRAFMSEGGEIVVEGTRLCSSSPWHRVAPRKGDTYLLVGAPDSNGIFYTKYYFRVENGFIVPATYAELKQSERPLSLQQLAKLIAQARLKS